MSPAIHTSRVFFFSVLPLVLLLAGCPTRTKESGAPNRQSAESPRAAEPAPKGEGHPYNVVGAESLLTIQVYRGGTLARVGHNHVIASHDLNGQALVNDDLARSSFRVQIPVASLTVDESELREQAGADFPPGVPDSAKEDTKKNLLGDVLLDAEHYPTITLVSGPLEAAGAGMVNAQVQVTVRDQTRTVPVSFFYEVSNGQLAANGELPLKQSDLGLKPFSVMMGALEVKDDMKVRFSIIARPAP